MTEGKWEFYEEAELGNRPLPGFTRQLVYGLAIAWSIFQLLVADVLLVDSVIVRSVHLAFAITLVYLCFSARKKQPVIPAGIGDFILAVVALGAALYLAIDYEGISGRQGAPIQRDVIVGVALIGLVLEASRRALGPALPVIASVFILTSLFASSLPSFLASRDVSVSHLVSKLTLSTEGIYGIPLRVSADTVFLFVLFGAFLDRAGGGQYFVELANCVLGRFRGGPAKAAVLASGFTGMVSGSSIANTVTTGTFTIPLMKRTGYPATKAAAIEVAASTNGQLMPPIMGAAAFIIAEYCRIPYIEVVRAALIPALISYLCLFFIVHLEASRLGLKGEDPKTLPAFWPLFVSGLHFLIPLAFLIFELVWLRHSPSLAAFRAILVLSAVVFFKNIFAIMTGTICWAMGIKETLKYFGDSLAQGARQMMGIGVAVAAAGIIVGVVSMGLGGKMTEIIRVISAGKLYLLLPVTAVISLLLGMGLPTTANYIIMANLTAPAIVALSGDLGLAVPLIAAHLFCFYFGILADDTPPVGLAAYAASAIANSPPISTGIQGFIYDMRTALLPFMFILNTEFLLIGVDSWSHGLYIFAKGLIGLGAFASAVQGYLLRGNRWFESAALLFVSLALFLSPLWQVQVGALGVLACVLAYQHRTLGGAPPQTPPRGASSP